MAVTFLDGITVAGNTGIGTTSPGFKLDVNGDTRTDCVWFRSNTSSSPSSTGGFYRPSLGAVAYGYNANELFRIAADGKVGIGTTNPGAKLHVRDTSASTSTVRISAASNNANYAYLTMTDTTANTARLTLGTTYGYNTNKDTITLFNGNVGVGTTSPIAYSGYTTLTVDGSSGAVLRLDRADNTNQFEAAVSSSFTYLKNINSKDLWFGTNNTERMRITSGGNIGIGTTAPDQKLTVAGNVRAAGVGYGLILDTLGSTSSNGVKTQNNYETVMYSGRGSAGFVVTGNTNIRLGFGGATTTSNADLLINSSGNVGIGTTSPSQKLEVSGKAKITTSLAVGAITPSATTGRIDASNDVVAFSTSDIRLKNNIKTIDKALDKVNSIQGVEFDWIEKEEVHGNSGHDIGVIAQEIEKILPDVVTTRDSGYKAVKYEKIVPLLIEAIKDLSKQVDGLKRLI